MRWRAWLLARVLLTLSAALVVTGCTERQVHVTGASGPIAWQVADFRIVARSVQGTPRELYTFTLVLQETQGTASRFSKWSPGSRTRLSQRCLSSRLYAGSFARM